MLLGHLTSVIPAIPLIRLNSRFLQLNLNSIYRLDKDFARRVPLSVESRRDLRWIACLESHQCEAPMWALQMESWRCRSVNRCVGPGLGHILSGGSALGSLDLNCRCSSPYQCKGAHDSSHLPSGLPLSDAPLFFGALTVRRRWLMCDKVTQCLALFFLRGRFSFWHTSAVFGFSQCLFRRRRICLPTQHLAFSPGLASPERLFAKLFVIGVSL